MKFQIGQTLTNNVSGESGECIARCEYAHSESIYLVRYKAADGRAAEEWWSESAIVANT